MKLTAQQVKTASDSKEPQRLSDGGGLFLVIRATGKAAWAYRYQLNGIRRDLGLGPYPAVTLSRARQKRDEALALVRNGVDPKEAKDAAVAAKAAQREAERTAERQKAATFRTVAEQFIDGKEAGWRNPKHRQQWRNTLRDYAHKIIGDMPVADVATEHVLEILRPIWLDKPETAKRVQGRIERILDYAKTLGLREGENPARWRGHLDNILPPRSKVARVQHQRALPWADAPELASKLRSADSPGARALLLTLLCATRTGETLGATWDEIDLNAQLWTIPGERMKAGKPHRVPLSDTATEVLRQQASLRRNQWVFPSQQKLKGNSLSYMAMTKVLERMQWLERTTVHGLRSTFRDWVSDCTQYPDRLAEIALAHQLSDRVQAAYNRSDMMEQRRAMMNDWARFLRNEAATVVQLATGNRASR